MSSSFQVFLSPPQLSGEEIQLFDEALKSGWIAPFGPQLDEFEHQIAAFCGVPFALAVQSGTSALHLALLLAGAAAGEDVLCPTFTFAALPSMITLTGASPVFADAEASSWNLSLSLCEKYLYEASMQNKLPKALVLVHNYGIMADSLAFRKLCDNYGVKLIEDAAEAFGSENGKKAGSFGHYGILSFNGNKLITTGGGGALLLHSREDYEQAKKLSLQAKEAAIHYEHATAGFNYRMNNIAAAFGLAQLKDLEWRILRKKEIAARYKEKLDKLVTFQISENKGDVPWLTAVELHCDWTVVYEALKRNGFESRPLWKPLHLQPAFQRHRVVEGIVASRLFKTGLCLPSGLQLTEQQQTAICRTLEEAVIKKRKVL